MYSVQCHVSIINKNAWGPIVPIVFDGLVENDEACRQGARHGAHTHTRMYWQVYLYTYKRACVYTCTIFLSVSSCLFSFLTISLFRSFLHTCTLTRSNFFSFLFYLLPCPYPRKSLKYSFIAVRRKQELSRNPECNHESWILGHSNTTCTCSLAVLEYVLAAFS